MPHLENWSVISKPCSAYQAPELSIKRLCGIVSDHPKQPDGVSVITSRIQTIDYEAKTARTKNTDYTLGEPDAEWLKWCDANGIDHSHIR